MKGFIIGQCCAIPQPTEWSGVGATTPGDACIAGWLTFPCKWRFLRGTREVEAQGRANDNQLLTITQEKPVSFTTTPYTLATSIHTNIIDLRAQRPTCAHYGISSAAKLLTGAQWHYALAPQGSERKPRAARSKDIHTS
eukprot:gene4172-6519_t